MLLIRYRRLFSVFFIILFSTGTLLGQVASIHLKGTVYDTDNKVIDGASVFLLDASGKGIQQGMSAADGSFDLPANPGKYYLLVSYIGYTQYKSELLNLTKDEHLQKITLNNLGHKLAEVAIKGEKTKDLIQADGRKLIYNVAKSINAQGTNALEVLRKT
ncbi:MAG: carboxypeptidase-like regulatory domain-containing protein, partial [Pedobacter sp.]|nr:carboxypeptidase-like regulatory domain-containing protein [Pedobacter sp.]